MVPAGFSFPAIPNLKTPPPAAPNRCCRHLIDTNIIAEVRKSGRCDVHVSAWYASIADDDLFLSALVPGEIRKDVELVRPWDAGKAAPLERWLREVEIAFDGRVLGIDNAVSGQWGRMSKIRPVPVIDGLLAATALVNDLTLVTRNARDVAGLGATALIRSGGQPAAHRSVGRLQPHERLLAAHGEGVRQEQSSQIGQITPRRAEDPRISCAGAWIG